jgi:hypothetical protein
MGLLRTENDKKKILSICPRNWGFTLEEKKKTGGRTVVGGGNLDSSHIGSLVG